MLNELQVSWFIWRLELVELMAFLLGFNFKSHIINKKCYIDMAKGGGPYTIILTTDFSYDPEKDMASPERKQYVISGCATYQDLHRRLNQSIRSLKFFGLSDRQKLRAKIKEILLKKKDDRKF